MTPAVADDVAEAEPQSHGDALSLDSAEVDVDAALSGILGARQSKKGSAVAGPDSDQNPRLTKAGSTTLEQELVRASLAPTTRAAYMRSVNMLRTYVSSVCPGSKFFPVSRTNLAGFITHLFAA